MAAQNLTESLELLNGKSFWHLLPFLHAYLATISTFSFSVHELIACWNVIKCSKGHVPAHVNAMITFTLNAC